ncbi:MAG: cation:proton antiporter regulatory subunit, partial [Gammaproteobacteria bacterium]
NKSLGELDLRAHKVVVTALRREGVIGRQPSADTVLKAGDVLVIWGAPEDLEVGEEILLRGARLKAAPIKGTA